MHNKIRSDLIKLFESGLSAEEVNEILANLGVTLNQEEHKYVAERLNLVRERSSTRGRTPSSSRLSSTRGRTPTFRTSPTLSSSGRTRTPIPIEVINTSGSVNGTPSTELVEPSSSGTYIYNYPIRSSSPTRTGSFRQSRSPTRDRSPVRFSESPTTFRQSSSPTRFSEPYSASMPEDPTQYESYPRAISDRALSPLRNKTSNY